MTEGRRSPADPRDGEQGTSVEQPAEVRQQPPPGAVQPMPHGRRSLKATRASAVWIALVVGVLVLVAILIFVAQNSAEVRINFLWMHGTLALGIALLISAILGIVLAIAIGTVRMLQLRRLAKRPQVVERHRRQ